MTLSPEGGPALPVSVTTTRTVQGGAAIPVYGYMTAPTDGRPALGGPALPVRVLTAADLKQNGGQWTLEGRPMAMPVYTAPAGVQVLGGPALAVYPVNAWPTVPVVPAWTPTGMSGLLLWLKAYLGLFKDAAKMLPCTSDADAVYTWEDQSGNGRDAIQATLANRPKYKVNIQNGNPMVLGDATDNLVTASIAHGIGTGDFYIAAVLRTTTNPAFSGFWSNGVGNIPSFYLRGSTTKMGAWWQAHEDLFAFAPTTNTTYLVEMWRASGTYRAAINGSLDANSFAEGGVSLANAVTVLFQSAPGAEPLVGYIGEFIFVKGFPSAQQASIRTYLNGMWAVY